MPGIVSRQWWDPERLRAFQERRFLKIVEHAYRNVPFYARLWSEAGVSPRDIRGLDDLAKLPVVDTRQFRAAALEELITRGLDPRRCRADRTSGSTGMPLSVVHHHWDKYVTTKAMSVRIYGAHGVGLRDRQAGFANDPAILTSRTWYERLGFWPRRLFFTRDEPDAWIESLCEWNPHVIQAMPVTLLEIAACLERRGLRLNPRHVFASGARLEPFDRETIERAFGARAADIYGTHEAGYIAWQCPQCPGYHVNSDIVVLEVLRDGRPAPPGEDGEAVITNIQDTAMPFIRYNLGDMITPAAGEPVCGRALPLIGGIWGRNNDVIALPSGRVLTQYRITGLVIFREWVREWRLVQEPGGDCEMLLVARRTNVPATGPQDVRKALSEAVRGEVGVRVALVERIERERGTKWKSIVSHVPRPAVALKTSRQNAN